VQKKHGLEALEIVDNYSITMTSEEEKSVLSKYIEKFGPPKLRALVFFRVFRKE
jgi:hypothetical protein